MAHLIMSGNNKNLQPKSIMVELVLVIFRLMRRHMFIHGNL